MTMAAFPMVELIDGGSVDIGKHKSRGLYIML